MSAMRNRNRSVHPNYNPLRDLFASVTVTEAARRWHKHINSVRLAMAQGKLDCRLSDNIWLITTESLIRLWGKGDPPDTSLVEMTLPMWR